MHGPTLARVMSVFVAVKSVVLGTLAAILDVSFVKALLLVIASAIVTGIFGVVVALIQVRADQSLHARLDRLEARGANISDAIAAAESTPTRDDASATPPT